MLIWHRQIVLHGDRVVLGIRGAGIVSSRRVFMARIFVRLAPDMTPATKRVRTGAIATVNSCMECSAHANAQPIPICATARRGSITQPPGCSVDSIVSNNPLSSGAVIPIYAFSTVLLIPCSPVPNHSALKAE
jgi:hypothetical protein